MKDTMLLFDLDGTLWDSAKEVAESWNEVLQKTPFGFPILTVDDCHSVMGKTMEEIAEMLFFYAPEEHRMDLLKACETYEVEYIRKYGGTLMEGCRETIEELAKRGYRMGIVSNCQVGYVDAFLDSMKMRPYFSDIQEWGMTHLPKGDSIRILMERNGCVWNPAEATETHPKAVYIGDTQGDADAAESAGIPFYHAAYGFGTAEQCVKALASVRELLAIFR